MTNRYVKAGKNTYNHKSVLALIDENKDISHDPKEIIRHKARETVFGAKDMGWSGPPFDPKMLASYIGIQTEPAIRQLHSQDAEIRALADGRLLIEYNSDMPLTRQNFSIAHEIVHSFFPDFAKETQARQVNRRKPFDPDNQVEMLCDIGAAEILMPFPEFILDLKERSIGVDSLEELRVIYNSSRVATAIRMVYTDLRPCAVVLFEHSLKPEDEEKIHQDEAQTLLFPQLLDFPVPKLRVQFTIPSNSFPHFIPKYKSVNEDTPIYRASQDCCICKGICRPNLAKTREVFYAEAIPISAIDNTDTGLPGVMAFLFEKPIKRD